MAGDRKGSDASGLRCTWGIILLPVCLFLALSLFSYDWRDVAALTVPSRDPQYNLIGRVGAYLSFVLFNGVGIGAYLIPMFCLIISLLLIVNREERIWPRILWCLILMFAAVNLMELYRGRWVPVCHTLNIQDPGGIFSYALTRGLLVKWFSNVGTGMLLWCGFVVAVVFFAGIPNMVRAYEFTVSGGLALHDKVKAWVTDQEQRELEITTETEEIEKRRKRLERVLPKKPEKPVREEAEPSKPEPKPEPKPQPKPEAKREIPLPIGVQPEPEPEKKPVEMVQKPVPKKPKPVEPTPVPPPKPAVAGEYQLPPLDILEPVPPPKNREMKTDTGTAGRIIIETLAEFAIEAQIVNIEEGPVVARYELLPAPGVKVERISGLSNNLAMALKAHNVRVQAPIPGKGLVGIEVPNAISSMICLRQVLEGDVWKSGKARVPLALGKDVGGNDLVADLASMPHLLVAGATGSGKTVCMNSVLAGLLMAKTPSELRLLLVDPKIVEFSVFNDIPHLVVPVVTNPKKVAIALRWAIAEMEKRYKLFAKAGVRNIESYNTREIVKQQDLFGEQPAAEKKDEQPPKLPYIVIVVDELADLMLVDQSEIENCIARLAQLSRAVGIHMILSTQRPSVKVITGTIKANFPARIAFQLPQQVDSRTILDSPGAEKLLGRGDMLFLPPGTSKLIRAQGAMTKDDEMRKIVEFIKTQGGPSYEMEVQEKLEKQGGPRNADDGEEDDDLINQAIDIVRETQRASTSSLQRRLRIGYTRAARIMDIMEERGIVGPPRGSDAREILVDLDVSIPDNADANTVEEVAKSEET